MPHFYSPAGEGRVHQCLRFNKDKISERCRNEEMKLAAIEYRDIRLRPKLNKQCSEEKAVYCKVSGATGRGRGRRQWACKVRGREEEENGRQGGRGELREGKGGG